ncbi:glycerol-3-phosphate dehydrogenase, partial [Xanthomonas citri pv. citri]|nr:glycerol-3-phosphate dehydrogenase [Xanthomonas citri pv. citri]
YMFPSVNVTDEDIESTWAGIRPLIYEEGKDPSEISRKDEIWEGKSGLLTIAGGKLTGYRHMAQDIVDLVSKRLKKDYGLTFSPCNTKGLAIS